MSSFELQLSVAAENINFAFYGFNAVMWSEFWLNPRRLRGSDFLMRWSQGAWSEERITQAINELPDFFALPYGPSGVAPDDDPRAFELYFERLDEANPESLKRPDLLVFKREAEQRVMEIVNRLGGNQELPFIAESHDAMCELLASSVIAVECENSLWRARNMPAFGKELRPVKWMNGKEGLPKAAVAPTVIIKDEDRRRLFDWQEKAKVKIHIWQVFFDVAFGLSLDNAERLIADGSVMPTEQIFQAPGGATQRKRIYKIYYHHAYELGESRDEPQLIPDYIEDKNGHIMPFVRFSGGRLEIKAEAVDVLNEAANK